MQVGWRATRKLLVPEIFFRCRRRRLRPLRQYGGQIWYNIYLNRQYGRQIWYNIYLNRQYGRQIWYNIYLNRNDINNDINNDIFFLYFPCLVDLC